MHKDGSTEEEENSRDYMALHVYKNPNKGQKVLEDKHCVKRSVYSPEQTTMLYLELPSAEHLQKENCLNLVLDQHKRERDLFYNIRVYSQVPFQTGRAGMSFKFKQEMVVPNCPGGGVPSSNVFYKNPQFLIACDRQKVVNWAVNSSKSFDCLFSYTCDSGESHVKAFLCRSNPGNYRISTINDETIVDKSQKSESYKP